MKKIALLSLVASSILMANGWKIPETSTNAVALGSANIAHNHNNADAAYYNPAKMIFMSNENNLELDVTYIHLDKVKFTPATGNELHSESENVAIPTLHYVSPKLGESNARVGLSIVAPAGLSKRWKTEPAKTSAEEFTLKVIEINPSAAFEINDKLGFAVGFRIVRSSGVVQSSGTVAAGPTTASRDMTGDSVDFGYNFALAYDPIDALELGLTYRSKVDLTLEGNANLATNFTAVPPNTYNGPATLTVPLPATLSLAAAYTLPTKTTVEVVYERTYWSEYTQLDFNYPTTLTNPVLKGAFDDPKARNWKDTNTYRFGITQELTNLSLMAGLVIDETPVPEATLGYELPGTDTVAYSLGGRYKISDKIDIGLSALYSVHNSRKVHNYKADGSDNINGEFTDGNVLIISAGLGYKF
jgi:long-chain fatty acid transport protein